MKKELLRIIDANLNRAREGLRVCEEIVRFVLEDAKLTAEFKALRHQVSRNIKKFPAIAKSLVECRQVQTDVGRKIVNKSRRKNYKDLFSANIQRVKESLRVLEEFSSIFNRSLNNSFARLRFRVYGLEKKTVARL
ncbi:MAG: hypothetical protein NG712_02685 [Omnitrophica bacterium]|nr:hypothetical protein [Candidatus Omnitrophota bacterium]